jgi:hypothetical protein
MVKMKTRNACTMFTCVLSTFTVLSFVNPDKAEAVPTTTDCRQLLTGTYLTTVSANFGSFRGITTFTRDGNFFTTLSIQSGDPKIPPFSDTQGSWKCVSDTEIIATGLEFNYPAAASPASINRIDIRATVDPKDGTLKEKATLKTFPLNADPLNDDAPVMQTFIITGQRVNPGQ